MIKFTCLIASAIALFMNIESTDLAELRSNYSKSVHDRELCKTMIAKLEETKGNSAVNLGYLGAFQTIWANHTFSPISKLGTFTQGKKNIEQAIKKEPTNVELRFIRLSVQKNIPSFLGYKSKINEDTEFIRENQHQIESKVLLDMIDSLLEK